MRQRNKLENVAVRMVKAPPLYSREQLRTPKDVVRVLGKELETYDREVLCVVNLRNDLAPINMNIVSMGSLNASIVSARDVFKSAILSNAGYIMLAHNHTSGDPTPSRQDIVITKQITEAAELLDIPLADHVILGHQGKYFSFLSNGLMGADKEKAEQVAAEKPSICGELKEQQMREEELERETVSGQPLKKKERAEQYSFYRIPKVLFTDSCFKGISVDAKVLYGLLLDRMALSVKNGWMDEKRRVYIIYTIADVMETLGCAEQKANKLLKELDTVKGIGLIERVRRGLGRPNVIYVKNFINRKGAAPGAGQGPQPLNCENHKSGNVKTTSQDLWKSQTNKTDNNKTDFSNIYPSIGSFGEEKTEAEEIDSLMGIKGMDGMERVRLYRELIKDNIEFDILARENPHDRERLEGMVELMAEVCCTGRKTVRINQEEIPAEIVKSRFLKLDDRHIRYVMDCMDKNTSLIGNIRAYLLSALFNSPVTISQYYASLVSHDMAEVLCRGG